MLKRLELDLDRYILMDMPDTNTRFQHRCKHLRKGLGMYAECSIEFPYGNTRWLIAQQQDAWRLFWNNTKLNSFCFWLTSSGHNTAQDSVLPISSNPGVRIAISNDQQNNTALPLRIVIMQIIKITRSPAAMEIHMQKIFCIRSDPGVRNAISNELPIRCRSSKWLAAQPWRYTYKQSNTLYPLWSRSARCHK